MPASAPGHRVPRTATKAVTHGHPCVEGGVPGIAMKSTQGTPFVPTFAGSATAKIVAIGEEFIINARGRVQVLSALIPGGVTIGEPLYIRLSDNALVAAPGGGIVKFGLVEGDPDTAMGWTAVNLDLRDTF